MENTTEPQTDEQIVEKSQRTLWEKLSEVKELRQALAENGQEWEDAYNAFLADYAELSEMIKDQTQKLARAEDDARQAAIRIYDYTGEKEPEAGVKIKIFETPVYQLQNAVHWAIDHKLLKRLIVSKDANQQQIIDLILQAGKLELLAPDLKKFLKAAKSFDTEMDFVKISREPKAFILGAL